MPEDPLARMHREYREQCIAAGVYRPFTDEELERANQRWKEIATSQPTRTASRKRNPSGYRRKN